MSPSDYSGTDSFVSHVYGDNSSLTNFYVNRAHCGVRPVVSLSRKVGFSGGTGTISDPYIVE